MTDRDSPHGAFPNFDFTKYFGSNRWTGKAREDEALFAGTLASSVKRGVYVHYLVNDDASAVYDRNGKGKRLIYPHLATVKFGKFESSLIRRRSLDAQHLHRRPADDTAVHGCPVTPEVFAECLRLVLVLDMSGKDTDMIRRAERTLRHEMRTFIARRGLVVQDKRGDYRVLKSVPSFDLSSALDQWARDVFGRIARSHRRR